MEQKTKKMPFAPVKVRREKTEKKLTERQRAAQKRQAEQNRKAAPAKGVPSAMRQQKLNPNKVRITNLIAGELARAFAVILKLDGPADTLMKAFFKSNPKLGSRDRTILAEAIFYALRHYSEIAWRMKPVKPERAPKVAAFLTLAMQYGVESMGDQVLGSEKGPVNLEKAPPEVRAEMPFWLYELESKQYGEAAPKLFEASLQGAPLDLRVNTLKAKREDVIAELAEHKVTAEPMQFSPDGIRLTDKPGLIRWPVYQEGRIDIQDEGSQLIARLVGAKRGEMVCDFCAGAGGKTLALGALMKSSGRLYAFDINEKRLQGLTPRMRRAGLSNRWPFGMKRTTASSVCAANSIAYWWMRPVPVPVRFAATRI